LVKELPGEIVRRIRQKKRLSQQQVADRCCLQRAYVSQLEQGRIKTITLDTARELAKGLGVRAEVFLTSEDAEWLYMSEHIFEGMVRELRNGYNLGRNHEEESGSQMS